MTRNDTFKQSSSFSSNFLIFYHSISRTARKTELRHSGVLKIKYVFKKLNNRVFLIDFEESKKLKFSINIG